MWFGLLLAINSRGGMELPLDQYVLDLAGDDNTNIIRKKNAMIWDRKKKKYVQVWYINIYTLICLHTRVAFAQSAGGFVYYFGKIVIVRSRFYYCEPKFNEMLASKKRESNWNGYADDMIWVVSFVMLLALLWYNFVTVLLVIAVSLFSTTYSTKTFFLKVRTLIRNLTSALLRLIRSQRRPLGSWTKLVSQLGNLTRPRTITQNGKAKLS